MAATTAIEDEIAMDLVGDDQDIVGKAGLGDRREFVPRIDLAGRIMRVAEQQGARTGCRERRRECRQIRRDVVVGRGQRHLDAPEIPMPGRRAQRCVDRCLDDDAIAGREQAAQGHVEAGLDAREHDDGLGRDAPAVLRLEHRADGLDQHRRRRGVAEGRMIDARAQRSLHLLGHREIHVRDPERQDIGVVAVPFAAIRGRAAIEWPVEIEGVHGNVRKR